MPKHRTRVGVNGRNAVAFTDSDYALLRRAKIETVKMMSLTDVSVFKRIRHDNPDVKFIVRLYDDRFHPDSRPSPAEFTARMVPIIKRLKPFATKFEIHNEPNHVDGLEGWGAGDANAKAFRTWYMKVLRILKEAAPWAAFGFPGLAPSHPHRDLAWLKICREAVSASDWLGCHCYWQHENMLSVDWGLRFKRYHSRFPDKRIEITEFGDSTPNLPADKLASQFARYYQQLNRYPYLGSANAFIASSPDPAWARFVWAKESGEMLPVVEAVATMERKAVEYVRKRLYPQTGKTVKGSFLDFVERFGLRITGYPISDQITEDDKPAQYFQRVALEEHEPGKIRLKPVGDEAWASRKMIANLKARVEDLSNQPALNVQQIITALSGVLASLAEQIIQLQKELAREESLADATGVEEPPIVAEMRRQISTLRESSDRLQIELEAALKAKSEEQAALIAYLRSRIDSLLEEIEELKDKSQLVVPDRRTAWVVMPPIQDIVGELPKHKTESYETRDRSEIESLIIHHSAAPPSILPEQIAAYHIRKWDWPGIGYHFLIAADGTIHQSNAFETVSHHAAAQNRSSVGICFLGSFMEEPPPVEQLKAGASLVAWLLQELDIGEDGIKGHREVMKTNCPGNQWLSGRNWKQMLIEEVATVFQQAQQPPAEQADKAIYHYLLLPSGDGHWDEKVWGSVQPYVAAFQPSVGFRMSDAAQAENVTLVGGSSLIPRNVDEWLQVHGCRVERVAGTGDAETMQILDDMAEQGKRFRTIEA
ncbi:N-acetylmuramoyl-L-alanine amidase [Chloroflexota bacterium]